jgi:hypothetical protein
MCHVPSETESHLAPGGSWLCFLEQPYDIGGCILPDRRYLLDCDPPSRLVCIPVDYISSRERWRLDLCVNTIHGMSWAQKVQSGCLQTHLRLCLGNMPSLVRLMENPSVAQQKPRRLA